MRVMLNDELRQDLGAVDIDGMLRAWEDLANGNLTDTLEFLDDELFMFQSLLEMEQPVLPAQDVVPPEQAAGIQHVDSDRSSLSSGSRPLVPVDENQDMENGVIANIGQVVVYARANGLGSETPGTNPQQF